MRFILAATGCLLALSACTSAPSAEYFPAHNQRIVASASQWQIIARHAAVKLAPTLGKEVYLGPVSGKGEAADAIRAMLATALTDRGVAVLHAPKPGADEVNLEVTLVEHSRGAIPYPGSATLLGTIGGLVVWAVSDASVPVEAAPAIGLGVGAAVETLQAVLPRAPNTEVILTAALTRNGADVARSTSVYYVAKGDADLYEGPLHPIQVRIQ